MRRSARSQTSSYKQLSPQECCRPRHFHPRIIDACGFRRASGNKTLRFKPLEIACDGAAKGPENLRSAYH
jgi:hypothetical protein